MSIAIGIDPGVHGAVVVVGDGYNLIAYFDCPVIENVKKKKSPKTGKQIESHTFEFAPATMANMLREIKNTHDGQSVLRIKAFLEKAQAMSKQGVSSTFKTGRGFGLWEGILVGLGITYDVVPPRAWSKDMLKGTPGGDTKQKSLSKAQQLYPDLPLMKPKGRVLSLDGRSDAALIATYGMKQMLVED